MKDRSASWMTLGLAFLLALSTFWLNYAIKLPNFHPVSHGHSVDFVVDGLHATAYGPDGAPQSILSAQNMIHYPDDDTVWLTSPNFMQLEKTKPTMIITADRGKLVHNTRQVYFMSHVLLKAKYKDPQKNWEASTDFLHIDPNRSYADTSKPVQIKGQGAVITAGGMNINTRTRIAHLLSHVQVTYH